MNDDLQLDIWSHNETIKPHTRIVMLGASNLSRAFPIAVSLAQNVFEKPLSIYVAKGHGRSYGKESSCFGKKNSGIFSCGIWRALERENSMPTVAFLTDIGNDLAYEVPVETIHEWVSTVVDRLLANNAQVVLSDLPLTPLAELSEARYRLLRALFFPQCQLELPAIIDRATQLRRRLHELAENRNIPIIAVQNEWYGFDPIHPRRRFLAQYWANFFEAVAAKPGTPTQHRCPRMLSWYLRRLQPEFWSFFTLSRRATQPAGCLHDGTRIFLY